MKIDHSLLLPRDAVTVPAVRRLCRSTMADLGIERADIDDVMLALTEACSNVVEHANGGGSAYQVNISISVDACEILIIDDGATFDPAEAAESFDEPDVEHGRGLPLMRSLVDVAEFTSQRSGGNVVRLVKDLHLTEDALLGQIDDCGSQP